MSEQWLPSASDQEDIQGPTVNELQKTIERLEREREGWKDIILTERKGRLEAENKLAAMTTERDNYGLRVQGSERQLVVEQKRIVALEQQLAASQTRCQALKEQGLAWKAVAEDKGRELGEAEARCRELESMMKYGLDGK